MPIDFLVTGEFPGDGQPKPIAFPDPADVSMLVRGVRYASLETLVELELASGMSAPHRLSDLADVLELVRRTRLDEALAERLAPSVREKYRELWRTAQAVDPLQE